MKLYSLLEREIRNYLKQYLAGDLSLEEFSEWFVSETWDVERENSIETQELAFDIDAVLIEYAQGHLSETELRKRFRELIEEIENEPRERFMSTDNTEGSTSNYPNWSQNLHARNQSAVAYV